MGLKWYSWHTGKSGDHYSHDILSKTFPHVVEVDCRPVMAVDLDTWLDLAGLSEFSKYPEPVKNNNGWRTFYFKDSRPAVLMKLVFG